MGEAVMASRRTRRFLLVVGSGLLSAGLAACGTAAAPATGQGVVRCPDGVNGSCDDGKLFTSTSPTPKPKPTRAPVISHTVDFTVSDAISGSCVFPKDAEVRLADEHGTILASPHSGSPWSS